MTDCQAPHPDNRATHHADIGLLCRPGYTRLEQHLAELPALVGWLHANLAAGGQGEDDGSRRTKGEPPIPIRDTVHDHLVLITETLSSWAQLVAEERQLVGPDNTRVTSTATFLVAHLPWSAQQDWVDDLAGEVDDLTRTGHQLAPSRPGKHRLVVPCPTCDTPALTRADGDDYIQCEACGRLWTEPEYIRLCVVLAAEVERTAELPEWVLMGKVAERFGVNVATVRKWEQRGQVESRREGGRVFIRLVCDVEGAA